MAVAKKGLRQRLQDLESETYAVFLACKDPRTPWYAKAIGIATLAYFLSPIDLIPDPIPVIGYLDDLIIVPLGIILFIKLIPPAVMVECREKAQRSVLKGHANWYVAAVIICIWMLLLVPLGFLIVRAVRRG